MSHILNKPDVASFEVAVATQRSRLEKLYVTNDYLPHQFYESAPKRLRVKAPSWAAAAWEFPIIEGIGTVLALLVFGAGWRIDHLYVTSSDNDGMAVIGGFVAAVVVTIAFRELKSRVLRPHTLRTTRFSAGLFIDIADAQKELEDAALLDPQAARLADAALALDPMLEVLAEEEFRLHLEKLTNQSTCHRSDYRAALREAQEEVRATMLDVASEIIAAAGVVFASRDDLLVELARAPKVGDVILRQTLVTDRVQASLEAARRTLREAASTRD